jgi:hypothetical protein
VRATEEAREEGRRLISLNPQLLTIALIGRLVSTRKDVVTGPAVGATTESA